MGYLQGKDVQIYFRSSTYTSGNWKVAICATQHTLDRKKNEVSTDTKCGKITAPGTDDNSISLDLIFVTGTPAPTEITSKTLVTMYDAGAEFDWMIADEYPGPVEVGYKGSAAVMTACTEVFGDGFSTVALTIKVNGAITSLI